MNEIVNQIVRHEEQYRGYLMKDYETKDEFIQDLSNEITVNGVSMILDYYKTWITAGNDTNTTEAERLEINNIISLLEGYNR